MTTASFNYELMWLAYILVEWICLCYAMRVATWDVRVYPRTCVYACARVDRFDLSKPNILSDLSYRCDLSYVRIKAFAWVWVEIEGYFDKSCLVGLGRLGLNGGSYGLYCRFIASRRHQHARALRRTQRR